MVSDWEGDNKEMEISIKQYVFHFLIQNELQKCISVI